MPIPKKYLADFEEGGIYHVYNRTNNKELLFLNDDNRIYFLKRYRELLSPFADTYCWNLLSNHFHLLIKIKTNHAIQTFFTSKPVTELVAGEKKYLENKLSTGELIEQAFKRFFQSYALAFNKVHHRSGNLFYKPFKRIRIVSDNQFTMAMVYIHANALKHKLVKDFAAYPWSSWQSLLSDKPTLLAHKEVIEWFGNIEACIKAHQELSKYYYEFDVAIEE